MAPEYQDWPDHILEKNWDRYPSFFNGVGPTNVVKTTWVWVCGWLNTDDDDDDDDHDHDDDINKHLCFVFEILMMESGLESLRKRATIDGTKWLGDEGSMIEHTGE